MKQGKSLLVSLTILIIWVNSPVLLAQDNVAEYVKDRGNSIPTSMYGTYINKGELLVYPFVEYSVDDNREYQPFQYGFNSKKDFYGKFKSFSEQIFIGYGITARMAIEFEAAYITASFKKDGDDNSALKSNITESGLADFESQIRYLLIKETNEYPAIFGFASITFPSNKNKLLIRDKDLDIKLGAGVIKGFKWGTLTFRTDLEYNRESKGIDLGETSLEYLKRISKEWRLFAAIEGGEGGAPDEWVLVTGIQYRLTDYMLFKFDNSLGIMPKATDLTASTGLLFNF